MYRNKYRIPSARLKNWDYSSSGWYFVTICTKNKICYLGTIIKSRRRLSTIGKIVDREWLKTLKIRPNVKLDEYTILPNHIHGIIVIKFPVETHCNASLQNKFGPQRNNLASIIRGFKSASTSIIHTIEPAFQWQLRFYDHIIHSEQTLNRIRWYIRNNHLKWDEDEENPFHRSSKFAHRVRDKQSYP